MSHGSVMKPLVYAEHSPSQHSLSLMEKKLEAAEAEARHLMAEIGQPTKEGPLLSGCGDLVGQYAHVKFEDILERAGNSRIGAKNKTIKGRTFKTVAQNSTASDNKMAVTTDLSSPIKGDNSKLAQRQNYDALVSRMCRTESAIQSLKFNLLNLKGNYDLKKKQQLEAEDKLTTLSQKYEEDVGRLNRELSKARHDLSVETEAKTTLESQLLDLKNNAKSQTETQVSIAMAETFYLYIFVLFSTLLTKYTIIPSIRYDYLIHGCLKCCSLHVHVNVFLFTFITLIYS